MLFSARTISSTAGARHRRRMTRPAAWITLAIAVMLAAGACRQQPATDASQIPHTPIPKVDARLQVANNNGSLRYEGSVADEATKAGIERSLKSVYGSDATGAIALEPNTNAPPWANGLGEMFMAFRMPGGVLAFEGKRIELSGAVGDEDRATLLKKARELYPDYEFTGLFQGVDMAYALPDRGDGDGLVVFLNAIPINFQEDSGMLTPDSLDGISRAARAIRSAAAGQRIRIGVHPLVADMPEYDRDLAFQRANAVKVQLAIREVDPGMLDAEALPARDAGKGGKVEFALAGGGAAAPSSAKPATPSATKQEAPASGSPPQQE